MIFVNVIQYFTLILSGFLQAIPWLNDEWGFVSLFSLIPLLQYFHKKIVTGHSLLPTLIVVYLTLLCWCAASVWWIACSTLWGLLIAILFYPLLLLLPFLVFRYFICKTTKTIAFFLFITTWIGLEWMFLNIDIAWPWMILGNAFARSSDMVQWYEYTGVLGGSLWILLSNVLWSQVLFAPNKKYLHFIIAVLVSVSPAIFSIMMHRDKAEPEKRSFRCLIVQPNIDSYSEKFSEMSADHQITKMLSLASDSIDTSIDFVVLPETALSSSVDETRFANDTLIKILQSFCRQYSVTLVTGAQTHKSSNGCKFYYNSALVLDGRTVGVYHKSKLLPGVETMPLIEWFPWMKRLLFDFGGDLQVFTPQKKQTVFRKSGLKFSTAVCYENEYGAWMSGFAKNGAGIIFLLTNDGWWGDTPGYKQHIAFSKLRAIETGCPIVRCANTGVSALIDKNGTVEKYIPYGKGMVLKVNVTPSQNQTVYTLWGDYIGIIALLVMIIISGRIWFLNLRK